MLQRFSTEINLNFAHRRTRVCLSGGQLRPRTTADREHSHLLVVMTCRLCYTHEVVSSVHNLNMAQILQSCVGQRAGAMPAHCALLGLLAMTYSAYIDIEKSL